MGEFKVVYFFSMGELGILKQFFIKYLICPLIIYKIIHFILNIHIIFVVEIPKIEIRPPNFCQNLFSASDFYPKFCGIICSPQISTNKIVGSSARPPISTKFWLGSSDRPYFWFPCNEDLLAAVEQERRFRLSRSPNSPMFSRNSIDEIEFHHVCIHFPYLGMGGI